MELSKLSVQSQAQVSEKEIISYLEVMGIGSGLQDNEKKMFIQIAIMNNLNPFKREIYMSAYGTGAYRKTAIITGYEVYIKRAEISGRLNGWSVEVKGKVSDSSLRAIITIHRKDFDHPFSHEVYYAEYVQRTKAGEINKFWKEKPVTMTKKVAIAQGFRMCFNEILGGLPYTKDEFLDEDQTTDVEYIEVKHENSDIEHLIFELSNCQSREDLTDLWKANKALQSNSDVLEAFIQISDKFPKEIK